MPARPEEQIRLDERRHAVVLAGPFVRALVRAVWRWERTHVVVTSEKLFVVHGTLRRRAAAVRLNRVGAVELEQSLLGYGTVSAGGLGIDYVANPREMTRLLEY